MTCKIKKQSFLNKFCLRFTLMIHLKNLCAFCDHLFLQYKAVFLYCMVGLIGIDINDYSLGFITGY